VSNLPTPPQDHGPDQPKRWWHGPGLGSALRVPSAIVHTATLVVGVYAGGRWLSTHIPGPLTLALFAGALMALVLFIVPPRKIFSGLVGWWVRRFHADRDQRAALRTYPAYARWPEHLELLGLRMKEVCRSAGISTVVGGWLARHPHVVMHEEQIRRIADALLLPLEYLQGTTDEYGPTYTERRLFLYWSRGLARAWTWEQITAAGPEGRREILNSIEALRRDDIRALKPGGGHA
jgi:hypothetical protein